MVWKVGDTALCVDAKNLKHYVLIEGHHYKVSDILTCKCCIRLVIEGVSPTSISFPFLCDHCEEKLYGLGFYSKRFIKLAGDDIDVGKEDQLKKTEPLEYGGVKFDNLREKVKSSG